MYLFKILAEFMVQEGVSHVLKSNSPVPQQSTLGIMLGVVPTQQLSQTFVEVVSLSLSLSLLQTHAHPPYYMYKDPLDPPEDGWTPSLLLPILPPPSPLPLNCPELPTSLYIPVFLTLMHSLQ